MTDKEKVKRIAYLLNDLELWDMSREELIQEMKNCSFDELAGTIMELYAFAKNVCDVLNTAAE